MKRDWTEANKQLRDLNIQIAEERGRPELEQEEKEANVLDPQLTAAQIKKSIRRMRKCQQRTINLRARK